MGFHYNKLRSRIFDTTVVLAVLSGFVAIVGSVLGSIEIVYAATAGVGIAAIINWILILTEK